ncbi:MAG: TetR/AcrR family transcriptional regulator [Jatrophihabitans sp.]|nr:MAG: TetR/AcrR family transcriptional regulator [Jatrophihabitans sp.]
MAYRRTGAVQARLDAQRAALVAAAVALVAEGGYRACTVAAVAGRAGVAAGSVYNHFAGKLQLITEVFQEVVGREVAAVRDACAPPGTAAERVTAVVETFANRALKSPRLAYALLAEPVDPAVDALRLRFRRTFTDLVADAIRDGVTGAELPRQDRTVSAAAVVGAIGEVLAGPLASGGADPDVVPALVSFVLRGIGADHAHP